MPVSFKWPLSFRFGMKSIHAPSRILVQANRTAGKMHSDDSPVTKLQIGGRILWRIDPLLGKGHETTPFAGAADS
jgi:hypothetical protein